MCIRDSLKAMLKEELAKEGYEVGEVEITVGTTYEAVGEGLEAGTIDVGLIPGGTYVPVSYTHLFPRLILYNIPVELCRTRCYNV